MPENNNDQITMAAVIFFLAVLDIAFTLVHIQCAGFYEFNPIVAWLLDKDLGTGTAIKLLMSGFGVCGLAALQAHRTLILIFWLHFVVLVYHLVLAAIYWKELL